MNSINNIGVFRGRTLLQTRGSIGGSRQVFVKLQGDKNELVYPPIGGLIMNPFKGTAKAFAGDLCEYIPAVGGESSTIKILKTYKVVSASGTTVNIERTKYSHIPFVGDILGVAPNTIGGEGTAVTVTAVTKTKVGTTDVWALTTSAELSTSEGDILVEYLEAGSDKQMFVTNINAVIDCDLDFLYEPADPYSSDYGDEFDKARYFYAPSLRATMLESKMSPIPECVKKLNLSNVKGWFRVDCFGHNYMETYGLLTVEEPEVEEPEVEEPKV